MWFGREGVDMLSVLTVLSEFIMLHQCMASVGDLVVKEGCCSHDLSCVLVTCCFVVPQLLLIAIFSGIILFWVWGVISCHCQRTIIYQRMDY